MLTKRGTNELRLESTPVIAYFLLIATLVLVGVGSWATYYGCRGYLRGYDADWDAIYSGIAMLTTAIVLGAIAAWMRRNPADCVLFDVKAKRAKIIRNREVENEVDFADFFPLTVRFVKSKRPQGIGHWELICAASELEVYYTSSEEDANAQKSEIEQQLK